MAQDKSVRAKTVPRTSCMRSIWKGTISFGLVNIPIALYPATRRDEIRFRLLRANDLSPVNYKRVAEADGNEVGWDEIVKGYEYEKGRFVVLKEEDFQRVDVEATQTVEITDFVELSEVNPMFFNKPYFMEPQKGGEKAYALLREALKETGKIGIAKVVIKTRQYLAAVKSHERALVLELMHFCDEIGDVEELKIPNGKSPAKNEMAMAKQLIESMTTKWEPEKYGDDYREALMHVIEEKIESGGKEVAAAGKKTARKATNVIDLVSMLQRSLDETKSAAAKKSGSGKTSRASKSGSVLAKKHLTGKSSDSGSKKSSRRSARKQAA